MHDLKGVMSCTKSYTAISDIFGPEPFSNVLYRNPQKNKDQYKTGDLSVESEKKKTKKNFVPKEPTLFITSEKYLGLNKNLSCKSIVYSTSTIFCDLDDIAKRHSFHCLTEISMSNANILKVMKLPINKNGFKGKSNAVVQECATQIHPKLPAKDSMDINSKKIKKKFPQNDVLSSEIYLRDRKYGKHRKNQYYNIDYANNQQKFWSYAKYRTDYTKPIQEEKKSKKKERGKRTEDPCPCQLFSYACPCTDEKSLCELAKNGKPIAVADQITSTSKINNDKKKKHNHECVREDKVTNTNVPEKIEVAVNQLSEPIIKVDHRQDTPVFADISVKSSPRGRRKHKKTHRVICPKCNERVEVISTTEDEDFAKLDNSSIYKHSKEITPSYNCSSFKTYRQNASEDGEVCNHDPRCELVPVCQILPAEELMLNSNSSKRRTSVKSIPRVIRVTKACRHHPPCTVVPSCQRANVLRNNCEYIPPCLHRPRCVNLPLCVPFSKSIHYDETCQPLEEEPQKYMQASRCKYIPECRHEALGVSLNHHYNMVTRVQNACDYINGNGPAAYAVNPKTIISSVSPVQISNVPTIPLSASPCCSCRSNKSCQHICSECQCVYSSDKPKGGVSCDGIIFIRDVGCQFMNKNYLPKSLQSKTSSVSYDLADVNAGNYYSAVHTLRCEDKFTSPKSGLIESISTDSTMSMEVDSQCPSHGRRASKNQCTGFSPSQRYTAAFVQSHKTPTYILKDHKSLGKSDVVRFRETFPVKSRRNVLKGKFGKVIAAKRRRRSKVNNLVTVKSTN